MAADQKVIYVYDDFSTSDPVLMGMLYVNVIKGGETYSFEYNDQWLKKTGLMLMLDPELMPYSGRQYPVGKKILACFRMPRQIAEDGSPQSFMIVITFWGVYDETRMGGIRFKKDPDGPFLSDDKETAAPPWTALRTLEEASRNFEKG